MSYSHTLRYFLISTVLVIALFLNPKNANANTGYWVCTYSAVGPNNKKYMSYSSESIALMYLGYTNYYNGKTIKIHQRQQYDYLTASMFLDIGIGVSTFNYNKYLNTKNDALIRSIPSIVKDDMDMVVTMKINSPSIGYISEKLPIYDVVECLDRSLMKR